MDYCQKPSLWLRGPELLTSHLLAWSPLSLELDMSQGRDRPQGTLEQLVLFCLYNESPF